MGDHEKLAEVEALVRKYAPEKNFRSDMALHHDLSIDGLDADHLLKAFAERFGVDISQIDLREYFFDEGGVVIGYALFGPTTPLGKKLLTASDLVDATVSRVLRPKGVWRQIYWRSLSNFCRKIGLHELRAK